MVTFKWPLRIVFSFYCANYYTLLLPLLLHSFDLCSCFLSCLPMKMSETRLSLGAQVVYKATPNVRGFVLFIFHVSSGKISDVNLLPAALTLSDFKSRHTSRVSHFRTQPQFIPRDSNLQLQVCGVLWQQCAKQARWPALAGSWCNFSFLPGQGIFYGGV